MNTTLSKVYAAIVVIPVSAVLFASIVGGGSGSTGSSYRGDNASIDAAMSEALSNRGGRSDSDTPDAEAYKTLGKYNPCIFIACEGEHE